MRFQKGQNTGPANVRWAGDNPAPATGRQRARKLYPGVIPCEVNGCGKKAERHHIDGNTSNNDRSNIAFLCNKHHKEADGRMTRPEFLKANSRKGVTLTAEHRAAISNGLRGRRHSPETIAKLSAAAIRREARRREMSL